MSTMTSSQAAAFAATFDKLAATIGQAILGKPDTVRLVLTSYFAGGHILLEDTPGTGKTLLARALAASVDSTHSRIQFTPDLLPSDVTGTEVYSQKNGEFSFHRGPIFASIVLADEINRASPKTQSALLEVMEESHITVDGKAHEVGRPFMVIATQNPIEQAGTYPLPEAQLDRFLIKSSIGFPDIAATVDILSGAAIRDRSSSLKPVITGAEAAKLADVASTVHLEPSVLEYIARLAEATRNAPDTRVGVSVRGCVSLVRAARVWAASQGRHYLTPDDVKDLVGPVWAHRIILHPEAEFDGVTEQSVLGHALSQVSPPRARAEA